MIKILYITPNFTIGGTEGQIFNLAINLNKSRFTPCVMSIGLDYGQRLQYSKKGIDARVFKVSNLIEMISFIKKNNIDIVHSFYYGDFSGWELLMAKLAGVKSFISSRRNMGYWRKSRHIVFDIFRNHFTDIIIANSYAVREKSIADEKLTPSKIVVIYNGIDFTKYDTPLASRDNIALKREFGLDAEDKIIGMISNIKTIKGYDYFLKAARIIKDSGYHVNFVIAGEGSDEPNFRKSVDKYGLRDSVSLFGLYKDVRKVISLIDIFMYPSLSEGFPNVILEAMVSGKAIVSTDVGGTKEMVQSGYSGILIPPRDEKALADGAIKLLENEEMARRMSEAAKKTARQYFSMDECTRQYEFIYEDLYQKKRGN